MREIDDVTYISTRGQINNPVCLNCGASISGKALLEFARLSVSKWTRLPCTACGATQKFILEANFVIRYMEAKEECIACKYSRTDEQEYRNHGCPACTCEEKRE